MSRTKAIPVATSLTLLLTGCSTSDSKLAAATHHVTSSSSAAQVASSSSSDSGCAGVTPNNDPATKLPTDVSWQPVGIDSAPVSKSVGPFKVEGHFRMCYVHSPQGAAFGALNIFLAKAGYDDTAIIEKQDTDGPGKKEDYATQTDKSIKDLPMQAVAYYVDSYDGQSAVVSVVVEQSGVFGRYTMPMVWTNGDWYENGQPRGSSYPEIIKSIPTNYVTFANESGMSN